MSVVSAEEEEDDRHAEEEFLRRSILVAIVDLLPHVQVVVRTRIEFEWDTPHPVEHQEGAEHIGDIGQSPRSLLRNTRNNVVEDLEGNDENEMDCPGSCFPTVSSLFPPLHAGHCSRLTLGVDPVGIEIGEGSLVTGMLDRLRRFLVDNTTGPSPPSRLRLAHLGIRGKPLGSRVELGREGDGPGNQ